MKKLALFYFLAITVMACKKDKFAPPEIQTLSVMASSPNSISLVGNIITTGNQTIRDYGFIYSLNTGMVDENSGIKISMGNAAVKGEFTKTLDNISLTNPSNYSNTIWVRAYITDQNGTVLGSTLSANLPRPTSNGISPSSGKAGETVRFLGKFYNPTVSNVVVTFQNIRARIISASDTEITAEIPKGVTATHGQSIGVALSVGGATVSNSMYFTILANVTDFSPKSGVVGSTVTLVGDNLPNGNYYSNTMQLYFGDLLVNNYNYSNQILVPFTVGATFKLYTLINGQKVALPGEFTVVSPQITSINPEAVLAGQNITINGSNFPTRYDSSAGRPMIKLGNGSYVDASYSSSTSFSYQVPASTADGDYTLYYKVGPHEVQAPKKLTILGYSVSDFSPTSGAPGREVNITGNFISGVGYYVAFGTINAYGAATSNTNLRVNVPTGLNAGKVKLTIDPSNRRIVAPGEFEIIGPSFTSFVPSSGVAGAQITIKGSGFFPGTYNTSVRFGTVAVTPISVTDNTIVVAVPSNVTPGAMKLTVVTGGQTVMHNDNFTITN